MIQVAIIEVRGAAGGEEAKIWASDLLRMYTRFAQGQGWKTELVAENTLKVSGENAFKLLENE